MDIPASILLPHRARRRMASPSMRRAVAIAIELERIHDHLAGIAGMAPPIHDRITMPATSVAHRGPIRLPRDLSMETLLRMQRDRVDAIQSLRDRIGSTMGTTSHDASGQGLHHDQADDASIVDLILSESITLAETGGRPRIAQRRTIRNMDPADRRSAGENLRAAIANAASPRAEPPQPFQRPLPDLPVPDQGLTKSYAIDLLVDGLIEHHGIDRDGIYREIERIRPADTNKTIPLLVSPASGANEGLVLRSLGPRFPRASFRLRGRSLETIRIELPMKDGSTDYSAWRYANTSGRGPTLETIEPMIGVNLHDFSRRPLAHTLRDSRFHDAMVIRQASRRSIPNSMQMITVLELEPAYGHLDPPGTPEAHRIRPRLPADVRPIGAAREGEYQVLDHARDIVASLTRHGQTQPYRITRIDGGGLRLRIADEKGDVLIHSYAVGPDTLADGKRAIAARMDRIVEHMRASRPSIGRPLMQQPIASIPIRAGATPKLPPREVVARSYGADAADMYDRCTRVDALVLDRLTRGVVDEPAFSRFHTQEGIFAVQEIPLSKNAVYRLEKFDRVMGKATHAVGTVEIGETLSPSLVEDLRDGSIGILFKADPAFARSQVRRVTVRDGMTFIAVRVDLEERPVEPQASAL